MMKILIVDDNQQIRSLLREYLPGADVEVVECADGDQAFALFNEHLPDWVLMDWEMPRVNGIMATREIKMIFPDARICFVSAFDDAEIRAEAFAAGAIGFVGKDSLFELRGILR